MVNKTSGDAKVAAVKKAKAAASGVKKSLAVKKHKVRRNTHFFRGRTLSLKRTPKFERKVKTAYTKKLDKFSIIRYPLTTESAMKMIEEINTLVFIVDPRASKPKIAKAVTQLYDVEPVHVNTLIRPDGQKKAFVRLSPDQDALDVANKIGII
ncbi:60S ribosomal protein L23a, putative [Theileria equi strain WA]|uniref:60S ribosomal protein L23a, putative n=1 Tax=Theileria equi strain WA TaxID=1537102 RepID=L1LCV7_THEEQ|nr:60S ribosomal protein L23a, putative [Theileria equi strain WA]EKX73247.1 60S ribosomal protein L23a, putative [Theileria equi strain WA]|eukprot:XP_004832699.1 60S ribosomal protein L23a, putative [Theileria equi strain WA]